MSFLVACIAVVFSGLQWRSDERQADEAQNQTNEAKIARIQAKAASDAQAKDVAFARAAAEESRQSAAQLARANEIMSETQRRSLALSEQQIALFKSSIHSAMQPLLYVSQTVMDDYMLAITVANKGRMTADLREVWCSGGIFIRSGSADIYPAMETGPGFFRWTKIVPDQQEKLEIPLFIFPTPGLIRTDPYLNQVKLPYSWLVVCKLSYSDELDRGSAESDTHNLRLCYNVSRSYDKGRPVHQQVSMCPPENLETSFKKLGK